MKKIIVSSIIVLLYAGMVISQTIPADSLYFGQTPPGDSAIVFAPGLISIPGRNEPCITFSPDGKTVFFYIEFYPNPGNPYIMFTTYDNDHWTVPDVIPFAGGRASGEPFFSSGGNRLYMFASNAVNHHGTVDLSYSEKQGNTWGDPISLGNPPNSESYQYHPCIVRDTSVYFSSNTGYICRSQYHNGAYQSRVLLTRPINYVGTQTWGDPYVAPDESYMIFKSIRTDGFGQHDLYISYRKQNGSWTNPKNLGNKINTPYDETAGDITPDGKYMTFGSNKDLFWVSTSFIDSLKLTNFIPYLKNLIPDQHDTIGQLFNYTIPDSSFIDDDGNNTLVYDAKLSNGSALPSWLLFNPATRTFSGTPANIETISIKVTATDNEGTSASDVFVLSVLNQNSIGRIEKHSIQIFPNPANDKLYISFGNTPYLMASLELKDLNGNAVISELFTDQPSTILDLTAHVKGFYVLCINIDGEIVNRKICIL